MIAFLVGLYLWAAFGVFLMCIIAMNQKDRDE